MKQKKYGGFFSEPIFLIAMAIIASFALAILPANSTASATFYDQHRYDLTTQGQHLRFLLDQEIAYDMNRLTTGCAVPAPFSISLGSFIDQFNGKTNLTCHYRNAGSGSFNDPPLSYSNGTVLSIDTNCSDDENKTWFVQTLSFRKTASVTGVSPDCCTIITDNQANDMDFNSCAPAG